MAASVAADATATAAAAAMTVDYDEAPAPRRAGNGRINRVGGVVAGPAPTNRHAGPHRAGSQSSGGKTNLLG